MTQEMMEKMSREEWRAYCKRMKALDKRNKKFPKSVTTEERLALLDWHRKCAKRDEERPDIAFIIAIVSLIIGGIANVVAFVFNVLTMIYR